MTNQSGLWGRLRARIEGEVPADTLEAYRRAGGPAYDLQRQAEERRRELRGGGTHPWDAEQGTRAFLLCAWNAFVLQTLGDQFIEADYRVNPATVGYVPPVTAEQVLALYQQVAGWLSRAQQAQSSAAYTVDLHLPADLPPWAAAEPCPREHLEGMLAAAALLAPHAETAVQEAAADAPQARQEAVRRLRELAAAARSGLDYAQRLQARHLPPELHEQIERQLKDALAGYYRLGQFAAMPELLTAAPPDQQAPRSESGRLPALPGQPGFDPWCLTDPEARAQWQQDREAREAIRALWQYDPDPRRTLAMQADIDAALDRGDIAYGKDERGRRLGFYYCCPWAPIYVVKRPVSIGGRRLQPLQEFTLDVSAEEALTGEFRREVLVGVFNSTQDVDYCNPRSGGHRD